MQVSPTFGITTGSTALICTTNAMGSRGKAKPICGCSSLGELSVREAPASNTPPRLKSPDGCGDELVERQPKARTKAAEQQLSLMLLFCHVFILVLALGPRLLCESESKILCYDSEYSYKRAHAHTQSASHNRKQTRTHTITLPSPSSSLLRFASLYVRLLFMSNGWRSEKKKKEKNNSYIISCVFFVKNQGFLEAK